MSAQTSAPESVARCIGIILDGNRRWAKREGLPTFEGHRRGYERLLDTIRWSRERGIKHTVVYAFSTENWKRDATEVSSLMALAKEAIIDNVTKLTSEGIRTVFVGDRSQLPADLIATMEEAERSVSADAAHTAWVCFSYGGRAELVAAARAAASSQGGIDEDAMQKNLWTAGMPDPDLIIRTGGRHRLSNFLLWQAAYSELFFLDTLWPDFSEPDLDGVLRDYADIQRNFGA
jgi:undecaprenyl diphosphate synthase